MVMEQHAQQYVELLLPEWWAESEYAERWSWYRLGRGKDPRRYQHSVRPEDCRLIERRVDRELARG
jgi:hypothetical protein